MRRPAPSAGFTVLELMIALAIIGLIYALAVPVFPRLVAGTRLKAVANEVMHDLRAARSAAIAQGRPIRLTVDADHAAYALDGQPRSLPWGCRLSMAPAVDTLRLLPTDAGAALAFFPDGSASGGTLRIAQGDRALRVTVDWLTGRSALDD